ncbi:MAG: nucleotidyl transferase AbiEii/AbiGii toxin family protein, partial [Proteobacteria bacterium]|nr:nucleotidyl transferase AbiEii/AbiGii toxin family protein [Pseudomonadota bacterium]
MTDRNHGASARARLLAQARKNGEDFQRLLVRYAIERLLYRLSVSPYAGGFVLKGATLFAVWLGKPHRATKDLDLLGRGEPDVDRLVDLFQ